MPANILGFWNALWPPYWEMKGFSCSLVLSSVYKRCNQFGGEWSKLLLSVS